MAMEGLFHEFLIAIQPIESPALIFDVISKWSRSLSYCKDDERMPDTNIDENSYAKAKRCLQAEIECWELLFSLYDERIRSADQSMLLDQGDMKRQDIYHINEMEVFNHILESNQNLRELSIIVSWLENNFKARDAPDLIPKLVNWEHTLHTLKKDKLLGKQSKHSMVSWMDPDVLTREKKQLHELDEVDNKKAHLGAFYYLRTGDHPKAISYLSESGHVAYAATLYGFEYTHKQDKEEANRNESIPAQVIPPTNRRIAHYRPSYFVTGNVRRDMWKRTAFMICDANQQTKYERAALGALCGHREAMLKAAGTWEDQLWSYLKTSFDVCVESGMRKGSNAHYIDMPKSYWDQGVPLKECLDIVNAKYPEFKPVLSPELVCRDVQVNVMLNTPEKFLGNYANNITQFIELSEDPEVVRNHSIRFVVHLLIVFRTLGFEISQHLMDVFVERYTEILVSLGYLTYIPYYVRQMSESKWVYLIAEHVSSITSQERRVAGDDIELFLKTAQINGLDVLELGEQIVEKLRSEDDNFHAANLEWISLCYNYVEDSKLVMLALLRAVVNITRVHIRSSEMDKAKRYMKEIKKNCLDEVSALSDLYLNTYVKEFQCYRLYTDSVDSYMRWVTLRYQEPKQPDGDCVGSLSDRTLFDTRTREYKERKARWEENFVKFTYNNFGKLKSLLEYENGFLLNCSAEDNGPHEHLAVYETRKVILGHIVRYFMQLVDSRKDFSLFKDFMSIVTCAEKNVYQSLPTDLQNHVFVWSEKFICENSESLGSIPR